MSSLPTDRFGREFRLGDYVLWAVKEGTRVQLDCAIVTRMEDEGRKIFLNESNKPIEKYERCVILTSLDYVKPFFNQVNASNQQKLTRKAQNKMT
jgi:hypothetical protein